MSGRERYARGWRRLPAIALIALLGMAGIVASGGGGGDGGQGNQPPVAVFTVTPQSGEAPLTVEVDASGASDPDGRIVAYAWDFGDGASGNGVTTSHTYTTAGDYTLILTVTDDTGASDTARATVSVRAAGAPPPDPASIATPLSQTASQPFIDGVAFLYSSSDPIQTGVAADTIKQRRAAVLRGKVLDRDGKPLPGVRITVHDHPEFGQTRSRADGMFDLVVNGGGWLTLHYQKIGHLTAHRRLKVPWRDYVTAPEVVLVPLDGQVTLVDLTRPDMKVARGSRVNDNDGERQATLLLPAGVTAQAVMADGRRVDLATLSIRATEFTVGESGPQAMPARLPPASMYTYALEYSVDEALDASRIEFDRPLIHYNEDFIGFPVGSAVPVGYYDRRQARWIASANGRVVKVIGEENGLARLDTDGDAVADDAATLKGLGVSKDELRQVAALYEPGQTLWRVPMSHFTPWDCNWPYGPPPDALPPPSSPPRPDSPSDRHPDDPDRPCDKPGSILACETQSVEESLAVAGTPFHLTYFSDLQKGYRARHTLTIPLSGDEVPDSLLTAEVSIDIAGRHVRETRTALSPNQEYVFVWDGKDAYGREVVGTVPYTVKLTYHYPAVYYSTSSDFRNAFGRVATSRGVTITASRTGRTLSFSRTWQGVLSNWGMGYSRLGGWGLDVHHAHYPQGRSVRFGTGRTLTLKGNWLLTPVVGGGNAMPVESQLPLPAEDVMLAGNAVTTELVVADDGSVYFIGYLHNIYRRDPQGQVDIFSSGEQRWQYGDGGPPFDRLDVATEQMELGPDGALYIAQWGLKPPRDEKAFFRIFKLTRDGSARVVASFEEGGDLPIDAADGWYIGNHGFTVASTGDIYFGLATKHRVFRLAPDGTLEVVAGNGEGCLAGPCGDAGPAREAQLALASALSVDAEGNLYILSGNPTPSRLNIMRGRLRRVTPDGTITTLAGCTTIACQSSGGVVENGADAMNTSLLYETWGTRVVLFDDGSLAMPVAKWGRVTDYGAFGYYNRLFLLSPGGRWAHIGGSTREEQTADNVANRTFLGTGALPITAGPDGRIYLYRFFRNRNYAFGPEYLIEKIVPPLLDLPWENSIVPSADGTRLAEFDPRGRHLRTLDARTGAALLAFEYDGQGNLIAIRDAEGRSTRIERDAEGYPTAIVSPHGVVTALAVDGQGYLASVSDPGGNTWTFDYLAGEAAGLLATATAPGGAIHQYQYDDMGRLTRAEDPTGAVALLSRAKRGKGQEVVYRSPEGNSTRYLTEPDSGGRVTVTRHFPGGASSRIMVANDRQSFHVTLMDGTRILEERAADPWAINGSLSPYTSSLTITTPGGISLQRQRKREPQENGDLSEEISLNGSRYALSYAAQSREFRLIEPLTTRERMYRLDEKGRLISRRIGQMAEMTLEYDPLSGGASQITFGTGSEQRKYRLAYDANGYPREITDPLGRRLSLVSDDAGRIVQGTLPGGASLALAYDDRGNLSALRQPGGGLHQVAYDGVDRLTAYTTPSGATTRLTYDGEGHVLTLKRPGDPALQVDYAYMDGRLQRLDVALDDGNGWWASLTRDAATAKIASIGTSDGVNLGLLWDGFLPTESHWEGAVTGTVRRQFGNLLRPSRLEVVGGYATDFTFNADGTLAATDDLRLSWDPQTPWVTSLDVQGVVTDYQYNAFGEVVSATTHRGTQVMHEVSLQYDALGRVQARDESLLGAPATTETYEYDERGRLTGVRRNGSAWVAYGYDDDDNRITISDDRGQLTATFDEDGLLLTQAGIDYQYGTWGQRIARIEGSETTLYINDALGRLQQVVLPDGTRIAYLLDGLGRRVGKLVDGSLVQGFLYDGNRVVAEVGSDGGVRSVFIYALRSHVPDYMVTGSGNQTHVYRIVYDLRGSVRLVVDTQNGQVVQRLDYDPFGRVLQDTQPGFQPFGFTGGLYDGDTGLVHMRAREYDPETGRFLTPDPTLFAGGSLNLYAYAQNDPINRIDPTGLAAVDLLDPCLISGLLDDLMEQLRELSRMLDFVFGDMDGLRNPLEAFDALDLLGKLAGSPLGSKLDPALSNYTSNLISGATKLGRTGAAAIYRGRMRTYWTLKEAGALGW